MVLTRNIRFTKESVNQAKFNEVTAENLLRQKNKNHKGRAGISEINVKNNLNENVKGEDAKDFT